MDYEKFFAVSDDEPESAEEELEGGESAKDADGDEEV